MKVGDAPVDLGPLDIACGEFMFVQYMPVVMPGQGVRIPESLKPFTDMVYRAHWFDWHYVYLTVKNLYVTRDSRGRPGWHLDGFQTNDVNYVWYTSNPTEFCVQDFDIADDCDLSVRHMTSQAMEANVRTYPCRHLLRLDPKVVHRVSRSPIEGYRCFAKVSVSRDRYDLAGNAHNYLFDYDWKLSPRDQSRNHPAARMKEPA